MIPFKNRFHGHSSLRYVYKNGQAIRSHLITVKVIANPHRKDSRIAVVVSKKVMKSAVRRNHIRRQIYEYMRLKLPHIDGVYDIAIVASSGELFTTPYEAITDQLNQLFNQTVIKK